MCRNILSGLLLLFSIAGFAQSRIITDFNKDWKFTLSDDSTAKSVTYDDSKWRTLDLPHDWSIEGSFNEKNSSTFNEAALPTGIGWYRKNFYIPLTSDNKRIYINFDGVYKNSEVWINGHYLGKRPNGYISFRYELTDYIKFGVSSNVVAVKVDNSAQPDSRWYSGSGIYRKVWLLTTNKIAIDQWGTFVRATVSKRNEAIISVEMNITGITDKSGKISCTTQIYNATGKLIISQGMATQYQDKHAQSVSNITIKKPHLWSVDDPYLYKAVSRVFQNNKLVDSYETTFGIRSIYFNAEKGFFLNGHHLKILGVCQHHDLGALGAAVNKSAIERQLQILKAMGCNAIRTAHNPPAPELLDLCDKMGFLVMDEAFDMWVKKKNKNDYHLDFEQWHKQDLEDQVMRDRNHPSVFIWSIGNEIREQFDSSGSTIAKELVSIIKSLDTSRPVTSALTENNPAKNFIYQSGALDLLGFNYKLSNYSDLPKIFPGQKLLASETMSALETRGHYDLPSDSLRIWPPDSKPFTKGNPDLTVSAYDNTYAYWGSSHEAGWNAVKKYEFLSGLFVWCGFDFLGEPVPYQWPARSSYYGIIDLAGFPKDVYYMYQSEWTSKPVLHLFPHWNWKPGQLVDVWAYYNNADEVELYLNGKSLGVRKKQGDSLHVMWRVNFVPGTLKAISRKDGKVVLTKEIITAGKAAKVKLIADNRVRKTTEDLSFVTVQITDLEGNLVADADNLVSFTISGPGRIVGVDNGLQTSREPFKASYRKAFNGKCIVIIKATDKGIIELKALSSGLKGGKISLCH